MKENFLIGTYTTHSSKGIYQVTLDDNAGKLSDSQLFAEISCPTYLAESAKHFVYSCDRSYRNGKEFGGVASFDGTEVPADKIGSIIEQGASPAYVAVDEEGQFVFSANYHTGNVSVFKIQEDGTLKEVDRVHDSGETGPKEEQQTGPHPHYANLTYDGRLAVCDLGLDSVFLYDLADSGKLSLVSEFKLEPGFGPRHIKFVESTGKAYVVGELSSKVAVLDYNEETAGFTLQQIVSTKPDDWEEHNGAAAIHLSSDNRFVYVSNRGNDSIAVFAIEDNGSLSRIQIISTEGEFPRDFNFNQTESYLVCANQNTNNLTLFSRDGQTGRLSLVQKNFSVPEGTCVALRK